jgi:N-acetylglucosaminyldiphosphoundecaprenol N-acetyl-beta-D-mannosaminyltransferase
MRILIQDIPVDLLARPVLLESIIEWLKFPGQPRQIVTLNSLMLVNAGRNQELKRILCAADLVTIDGFGIELLLRRRGHREVIRWAGIDLVRDLLGWCSGSGFPVFFYGGPPAMNGPLRQAMANLFPRLRIAGIRDGFNNMAPQPAVVEEVERIGPCLLLAGLGSPAQEIFLARHLPRMPGTVGIGVGGALEVLSGMKKEVPRFFRNCGWEWLYRMVREPERLRNLPDLLWFWYQFIRLRKDGGESN